MPSGNDGRMCGQWFDTLGGKVHDGNYVATGIGDYVRHLIGSHWELMVKVHDAMETGEIPRG